METMVTEEQALTWVAAMFAETPGRLTPETLRADIPEWDSLGVLTVMANLDSDFDVVLSDDEVQSLKKVGDILDILRRNGKLG